MFYITFHQTESNIWAYGHKGNLKTTRLLAAPASPLKLDELRGITLGPHGYLYVVNGDKSCNQVLVYNGSGASDNSYALVGIYADPTVSAGITHPFAVAFDGSGHGYISSQDTNVVTGLTAPGANPAKPPYPKATPLAVASFLKKYGTTFYAGTLVASSYGPLPPPGPASPPPNVPTPQGLGIDPPQGPASHSVRDVAVIEDVLYVADEPGNAVKTYSLTSGATQGQLQGQITNSNVKGPVHLLVNNGTLYITSTGCILAYNLASGAITTFLSGLKSPTGMAFDSDGNFFFADRKDKAIYQSAYDSKKGTYGKPAIFIPAYDKKHAPDGLRDEPEFLLYVKKS